MRQRPFGSTGLTVSEVGFGCARIGGVFESYTETETRNILRQALHAGITFFDTSDMYTGGESETLIGEAFRRDRDKVIIASKAGYGLPAQKRALAKIKPLVKPLIQRVGIKRERIPSGLKGSLSQDFSANYLCRAVERSLQRLKTDYLDLFQLHSPPSAVLEQGEFLAPLERLKRQGKIRYYGVSCETTRDAEICLKYSEISSLQIRLSLLEQSALADVVPRAAAKGVALIARECFAGGMLAKDVDYATLEETDSGMLEYQRLAERLGRPLNQVAVRFVLGLEDISVALVGMRTQKHVEDVLDALAAPALSRLEMHALRHQAEAAMPAQSAHD